MATTKPWGGRFSEPTHELVEQFTQSVECDRRLYKQDIMGSIAHARMLANSGILTPDECNSVIDGLKMIEADIDRGDFSWSTALEDLHMNIEAELTARIGEPGKKLHTGRSRNDQVATDMRLYLRDAVDKQIGLLLVLKIATAQQPHNPLLTALLHNLPNHLLQQVTCQNPAQQDT